MTDHLSAPLGVIETALQRLDRAILLRLLQDGLPAEVVRSSVNAVGLASSPDLEALYGWRNGISTGVDVMLDDIHVFPGFYLLSLEEAIANYNAFKIDSRWTAGWLPLFANGGGDFYVLDHSPAATGQIRFFQIHESEHSIEYDSLKAMLTTVAAAFEREVFFVDSRGYLEMDDLVFADLAAQLNPQVDYWFH